MGHYDIKPDNFMYSDAECRSLKMIDLGMSSGFKTQSDDFKGTVGYTAPEIWSGVYGPEADIWSTGVILYSMVTKRALCPMTAADEKIKGWVKDCAWIKAKVDVAERSGASVECMDMLKKMLCTDRHLRTTAALALRHPYVKMTYRNDERPLAVVGNVKLMRGRDEQGDAVQIIRSLVPRFEAFGAQPVFVRAVKLVMVHIAGYTTKDTHTHRLAYKMLDETGTGDASVETIEASMTKNGIAIGDELDDAFNSLDLNKDGYIDFGEFLAATLPDALRCKESLCRRVFSLLDRNRDGFIDQDDLAATFLGHNERHDRALKSLCGEMLAEVCSSSETPRLDFDELFHIILAGSTPISMGRDENQARALRMSRSGLELNSMATLDASPYASERPPYTSERATPYASERPPPEWEESQRFSNSQRQVSDDIKKDEMEQLFQEENLPLNIKEILNQSMFQRQVSTQSENTPR